MSHQDENTHNKKEIDSLSGVETTGHEWDGLKELNNPLPRWWVWVFFITVIWSIWYFVVYPAWPTLSGATKGTGGYTQFKELSASQLEIQERQSAYLDRFEEASDQEVLNDPELYAFAMAGGASAFKDNCATCHGSGASGYRGYPNLNDDDWLWGGTLSDIRQTLTHGIRADNMDTRQSQMPAFGKDGLLKREEVGAVTDYVMTLSGAATPEATFSQGREIFKNQCASCHGQDGRGMHEFGAPNLTDKIWLYGGSRGDVYTTVYNARAGMMPAWSGRLDDNTIRQISIYIHQLGGGEDEQSEATSTPAVPMPLLNDPNDIGVEEASLTNE